MCDLKRIDIRYTRLNWYRMLWLHTWQLLSMCCKNIRKPLIMASVLMERMFWLIPIGVLTANTVWLPGMWLAFSTTCGIWIEKCKGWWLPGGRSLQLKPGPWVSFPKTTQCFTLLLSVSSNFCFQLRWWVWCHSPIWATPTLSLKLLSWA